MKISLYCNTLWSNFLGKSPNWYKLILILFLIVNPVIFFINQFIAGWLLVVEFIFTLAMALKCYPLLSGGLLSLEAIFIGMTNVRRIHEELANNIEVLLLLIFMVAGVFFLKRLLLFIFTRLLLNIRSKILLALTFCLVASFLSAFLDALTVMAVVISVSVGFYWIYNQVVSSQHNINSRYDNSVSKRNCEVLEQFRSFLRNLIMHTGIGTALGGVMTIVGEPQNLIIAKSANWDFGKFFLHMSPISIPVFIGGLFTCFLVEKFCLFGYGARLPDSVRIILHEYNNKSHNQHNYQDKLLLVIQGIIGLWLIIALALHMAEAGLIGLSVIILSTSFTGITDERTISKAFTEALPFVALLSVFFVIVSVIIDQQLFSPIIKYILQKTPDTQLILFYLFNGLLSSISDNVFVGTVYINEAKNALENNIISTQQFGHLAVAINAGTNLPSIATPNGQAAFLFLLTSTLAPLIRLTYNRMVWMALPYTLTLTFIGLLCIEIALVPYV